LPRARRIDREATLANQNTILIVEDEELIAMAVVDDIADLGHPVAVATEASAMAVLREHDVRFAIVDYHLRHRTSRKVIATLGERGIPFIVCTGSIAEAEDGALDGLRQLPKPYLTKDLREVVAAAL
jgi:CheY-like chemotaxis protein